MSSPEIVHAPESTTVFLSQRAVFTCETRGGITSWRVNGTQREILLPEIRSDLVVSESTTPEGHSVQTLTIPARPQYNGTRIQCLSVIIGGPVVESDNATLTIPGPPRAVPNLSAVSDASSVTISWSAPFSLDVTGVGPDIWYSVLIYNVTDENNPTAILCTDCINITETHYTFTPDYLSLVMCTILCHPSEWMLREESQHYYYHCRIEAVCDDDVAVTYEYNEMVDEYILHGVSDMDLKNISLSSDHGVSTYTLSANKNFSIFFEVFTAGGPVNVSHDTFTTYDVQSLSVEEERRRGGGVLVRGSS
ncbi:hypothetical protein GBAR_LOCUS2659 [Geodia barretti]|uniref:Uncharacterized protein n=1 Tax=Geodia barretti TaxID=519541 RepID=A0AA35R1K2_GEOBA|nr:hypothetical protein GBAR_LOCUS2659 [Geodia barretti]